MRIFLVQSEFGVHRTTKRNVLIDKHYETAKKSELVDLPTGCGEDTTTTSLRE